MNEIITAIQALYNGLPEDSGQRTNCVFIMERALLKMKTIELGHLKEDIIEKAVDGKDAEGLAAAIGKYIDKVG